MFDLWCSYYVSTCVWHVFLINWWWWWWWNLQSYPTTVLNGRMWHFRGCRNILWPILHIFMKGLDPQTNQDLRRWLCEPQRLVAVWVWILLEYSVMLTRQCCHSETEDRDHDTSRKYAQRCFGLNSLRGIPVREILMGIFTFPELQNTK